MDSRRALLKACAAEGGLSLSLRPGRQGWLLSTSLELEQVRLRSAPWCDRVNTVHRGETVSRFFLQPKKAVLLRELERANLVSSPQFSSAQRQERFRRLRPFLRPRGRAAHPSSGQALFWRLGLRLEALPWARKPEALWRHTAEDFDQIWRSVPLFAIPLSSFQVGVLSRLEGSLCREPLLL